MRPGLTYDDKVLATGPIAYWPQSETAGLTAHCLVNPLQDGTYTGVTLANDNTGPFGTPAPWYDGATSFCDIQTAALVAALSTSTGSMAIWTKVNAVGVWTDGARRHAFTLYRDLQNRLRSAKHAVNNSTQSIHEGNNVLVSIVNAGHAETAWVHWAMTWDLGGNLSVYVDGALDGIPVGVVTAWVGAFISAYIGSGTGAPANLWHGWLGPCAVWDRVLTQPGIAALALV